jgi:hypothetical protein
MAPGLGKVALGVFLVGLGCAGVFAGFEYAAYEQTIADREVTTPGEPFDENVYQLPDGNWTYTFDYEYSFDQRAEVLDQGLGELYIEEAEGIDSEADMRGPQSYTSTKSGGKHDTQSGARDAMEDNFNATGTVTVYIDPFYPAEGSLSSVATPVPEALQYGGAVVVALGLLVLARMARRVSA